MNSTREFTVDGDVRIFRRSSACESGWCVELPADGRLNAVADSKSGAVLMAPAGRLVTFAKRETED